jgi:hypothetical protein
MADPTLTPTPLTGGQQRVKAMLDAGAPNDQVIQWQQQREQAMLQAGAPAKDVYQYWHGTSPDTSRIDRNAAGNVSATPPDHQMAIAQNPWEAFVAGTQISDTGLIMRGKIPDIDIAPNAPTAQKLAHLGGMFIGDFPFMLGGNVGGAAAGAAVPGAGETGISEVAMGSAGGYAAPTAMRETLVDYYLHRNGNFTKDFLARYAKISKDTLESAGVGLVTGEAGYFAKPLGTVARLGTEAATATVMDPALHGKLPDWSDFVTAGLMVAGMHAGQATYGAAYKYAYSRGAGKAPEGGDQAMAMAKHLAMIYAKTGIAPEDAIRMANSDPVFKNELLGPTDHEGNFTARQYFGQRTPDVPPPTYKRSALTIKDEHDAEVTRLDSEGTRDALKGAGPVPVETLHLVRDLEGRSGTEDYVSPTGAIGRYQIEAGTAMQYGFDPKQLHDPQYNEMVATHILGALQKQFKGNVTNMLVAYNAGPARAEAWIKSGRVISELPAETQKYLEHAQRLSGIGGNNIQDGRTDTAMAMQGDTGHYLPPTGEPHDTWETTENGLTSDQMYKTFQRSGNAHIIDDKGNSYPDPQSVASYMRKIGDEAGFKFMVGPRETPNADNTKPSGYQQGAQFFQAQPVDRATDTVVGPTAKGVYLPNTPDELGRRWFGLGKSEIAYHEIGHALDHLAINPNERVKKSGTNYVDDQSPIGKEIVGASKAFRPQMWKQNPKYVMRPQELMADAIAKWLSDPTARAKMPEFSAKYGDKLAPYLEMVNRNLPKFKGYNDQGGAEWGPPPPPVFNDNGDEMSQDWREPGEAGGAGGPPVPPKGPKANSWNPEGPWEPKIVNKRMNMSYDNARDRILSIVAPEVKSGILPDWLNPRKILMNFQSELTPARRLDEGLGLSGKELGIEDMLRMTYSSKERSSFFTRYGTLRIGNNEIERTSDNSFMKAYAAVKEDGGDLAGFNAYRLAKRMVEKSDQGFRVNVDTKEANPVSVDNARYFLNKKRSDGKTNEELYSRANEIMRATKNASLEYARDSGMFSDAQFEAMKALNQEHIVMKRFIDPGYNPNQPGKGFTPRTPVRKFKGSDRQIIDPTTAEVDNLHTIIAMADRNRAIGDIIGLIESKTAEGKEAAANLDMKKIEDVDMPKTGELLDENGQPIPDRAKAAAEPFLAYQRGMGRLGPDDFTYFRNGRAEIWRCADPDLAEVIRSTNPQTRNLVVQFLTKFAGLARAGITADLSYPFRAIFHGQVASSIAAEHGTLPFKDFGHGFWDVLDRHDEYQDWQVNGGAASAMSDIDKNYIQKDIDKLFETTKTTWSVYNSFKHPIEMMRAVQHNVDAMSRVGMYKRLRAMDYNPMKAASMTRTAYLDHSEGFSSNFVNEWSHTVPFMPIGFKDIEQVGAAAKRNTTSFLTKGALILTVPTVANFLANYYQDKQLPPGQRYSDLPRWQRDLYWVTPPINGIRYNIKKPYVMGFMFTTLPERFMDFMASGDQHSFDEWGQSFVAQFVPPFTPSFVQPLVEDAANKNFYTQRPLVPDSLARLSGYMQYKPDTSETAKVISRLLGPPHLGVADTSPIIIQNYMREWGGTLPMDIIRGLELPFKPPGPPTDLPDIPFIGAFVARKPEMGAQPIIDFYNEYDKFSQAHADWQEALKRQNPQEMQETGNAQAFMNLASMKKGLDNIHAVIDAINISKNMTADEKRQRLDSLYSQMVVTAQSGLKAMEQIDHGK